MKRDEMEAMAALIKGAVRKALDDAAFDGVTD
jgi:hypothetical protein